LFGVINRPTDDLFVQFSFEKDSAYFDHEFFPCHAFDFITTSLIFKSMTNNLSSLFGLEKSNTVNTSSLGIFFSFLALENAT
jgi:hypothetical protein